MTDQSPDHTIRVADIRALAAQCGAVMMADTDSGTADGSAGSAGSGSAEGTASGTSASSGESGSGGSAGSSTGGRGTGRRDSSSRGRAPGSDGGGRESDTTDGGAATDDGPDWVKESRKHEERWKKAQRDATKAAEDKAAAEQKAAETEAKHNDLVEGLAKFLGHKPDDAPPDPAKLQNALAERERDLKGKDNDLAAKDVEIENRDKTIATLNVELAAWREAMKQDLDAKTLMDLRSTERRLAQLDFASDDFPKFLTEALKELATDNPALRIHAAAAADAARAGIGAAGGRSEAAVKAGTGRMRNAYST